MALPAEDDRRSVHELGSRRIAGEESGHLYFLLTRAMTS